MFANKGKLERFFWYCACHSQRSLLTLTVCKRKPSQAHLAGLHSRLQPRQVCKAMCLRYHSWGQAEKKLEGSRKTGLPLEVTKQRTSAVGSWDVLHMRGYPDARHQGEVNCPPPQVCVTWVEPSCSLTCHPWLPFAWIIPYKEPQVHLLTLSSVIRK